MSPPSPGRISSPAPCSGWDCRPGEICQSHDDIHIVADRLIHDEFDGLFYLGLPNITRTVAVRVHRRADHRDMPVVHQNYLPCSW